MLEGVHDFLIESNRNGFGFFVVSVLFYLFLFFLIQFFQHQKRFYLLYSLYALINGITLLKYIDGVFFSGFFDTVGGRKLTIWFHYPSQLFGAILFTLFVLEIMTLVKKYPKYVKVIHYFYLGVTPIYLVLWALQLIDSSSYAIEYFHAFFFIPTNFAIFLWCFYMVVKDDKPIKWYILLGMCSLCISYFIITFYSFQDNTANKETLYFFYIGILLESILFALAIGLEQKIAYKEKALTQTMYIKQLEENQLLKESINRALSEELLQTKAEMEGLGAEAQRERTEKLAMKIEGKVAKLRLDALSSQMNPHFIFNALNSIKSYFIDNNRDKAIFYLGRFSKLIRSILESSRKDMISLKEEIDTLKMYVEIESDRFKSDLNFVITIDENIPVADLKVPCLFLQPFVENSIWHGLSTKKGKKKLHLNIAESTMADGLIFTLEDNGIGRIASKVKNQQNPLKYKSLGLTIIRNRLDFFSKKYNKSFDYSIEDIKDKSFKICGTRVIVTIPKLQHHSDF